MTDTKADSDIIDIDPATVIENDGAEKVPQPTRKSSRFALTAGIALLAAVGGGWLYRDILSTYLPSDQVSALTNRMEGLETTTSTLGKKVDAVIGFTDEMKSQLAAAQASTAVLPQLQSDSAAFKVKVAELHKTLAAASSAIDDLKIKIQSGGGVSTGGDTSGFAARVETIEKDIASLKQSRGQTSNTVVLTQSLADLKAKIAAGVAFKDEFDRIKLMVPAADGLDVLQTHADAGLPAAMALAGELKVLLPALKPAVAVEPVAADASWWSYATSLASGLITIRSSDTKDWSGFAAQAVTLAEQGDLGGALKTFEATEGALPVELQTWHNKVAARLQLEQALETISNAVLRQIAAKG